MTLLVDPRSPLDGAVHIGSFMTKKKKAGVVTESLIADPREITEQEYKDFSKYLLVRNTEDTRVTKNMVSCFIDAMNERDVTDLRDIFEVFLKLDRHAIEFWGMKNKRDSN